MTDSIRESLSAALREPSLEHAMVYSVVLLSVVSLAVALWWLFARDRRASFEKTLGSVSYECLSDVVLAKADDGEIHIDHVLLTEHGVYVIDAKKINGIVFGGDRLHDWTVLDQGRRYTISNPQAALFDRVAAVKQVVTDIPVEGLIVFSEGADFTKGQPAHVCVESQLRERLPVIRAGAHSPTHAAFKAQWQLLTEAAVEGSAGQLLAR